MTRHLSRLASKNNIKCYQISYSFFKYVYVGYALILLILIWLVFSFNYFTKSINNDIILTLFLFSIYFLLLYEYNTDRIAFISRKIQYKGNCFEIIGQIAYFLSLLFLVNYHLNIFVIPASYIIGILFTKFLTFRYWNNDSWLLSWRFPRKKIFILLWKRLSGSTGKGFLIYGILTLGLQSDILLIGFLSNPETVSMYYLLWRVPEIFIILLWRIPGTYTPFLVHLETRNDYNTLIANYKYGCTLMFSLAIIGAVIYSLYGNVILKFWLDEYTEYPSHYFYLAGSAMFFLSFVRWPFGVAYALANLKPLNIILSLELLSKVLLFYFLFPEYNYITPIICTNVFYLFSIYFIFKLGKDSCKKILIKNNTNNKLYI